jgi:hypothetical protein
MTYAFYHGSTDVPDRLSHVCPVEALEYGDDLTQAGMRGLVYGFLTILTDRADQPVLDALFSAFDAIMQNDRGQALSHER